ncbi:hypothetical protein BDV41DRAFT_576006 [Aspergillus transmontanensis]|uniref:ATPase inhibitor, mitochondrial n=1 Tax=Aspergillus transmontanensis TaxID=1034304 RepID=A0A5N6VZV7_9EURO|nr:hypothetical protein BDV41DRAFT_576006 [Aspergillus transmontanensis]
MLRQSIRPLTTANRALVSRSFSALAPKMAAGDTGAPRPGGAQHAYVALYLPPVVLSRRKRSSSDRRMMTSSLMDGTMALTHASSDQFVKREAAQENLYIHEKEREKLLALRNKVKEQRKHLDELDKHIEELTKSQGGEQN